MGKKGRTLYVDEETYRVLKELADRLKLSTSGVLRLIVQNNLPVIQKFIQSPQQTEQTNPIQQTEITETKEERNESDKLASRPVNRPVGKDYKKFFAERFGILYKPDEE